MALPAIFRKIDKRELRLLHAKKQSIMRCGPREINFRPFG